MLDVKKLKEFFSALVILNKMYNEKNEKSYLLELPLFLLGGNNLYFFIDIDKEKIVFSSNITSDISHTFNKKESEVIENVKNIFKAGKFEKDLAYLKDTIIENRLSKTFFLSDCFDKEEEILNYSLAISKLFNILYFLESGVV